KMNKSSSDIDPSEDPQLAVQKMRKTLKQLGKNQLITLVMQQVQLAIEQQTANKIMLEELKRLEDKYMRPEEEAAKARAAATEKHVDEFISNNSELMDDLAKGGDRA